MKKSVRVSFYIYIYVCMYVYLNCICIAISVKFINRERGSTLAHNSFLFLLKAFLIFLKIINWSLCATALSLYYYYYVLLACKCTHALSSPFFFFFKFLLTHIITIKFKFSMKKISSGKDL